jgi:AraC-like DNA-binding protein
MAIHEFTISYHHVNAVLRGPREHGLDISRLLKKSNIIKDILHEPMSRVTNTQYSDLVKNIWLEMNDEYMGLGKAPSPLGSFAMMCHAVIHCPNLEKAFNRAYRFYGLFLHIPKFTLTIDGEVATITLDDRELNDPDNFLVESLMVLWHRFGSWLIGRRVNLLEANFRFPAPENQAEYRQIFYCDINFKSETTSLKFPVKILNEKVVQNETSLRNFLKESPANFLARPDEGNSLVSQIRSIIGNNLSQELPNFEFVADALHTSAQTLRRRLKEEGLTYQELKDQMRRDTALYYLGRGDLSIQDVSEKLGFSEPSTFHRAFKKWTGITPGAYQLGDSVNNEQ